MTACSIDAADEPLAGTAPVAQCWVVIEQPGPWGREALLDSHLDGAVGRRLTESAAGTGTRILLARHPDRLERTAGGGPRYVWVAHCAPGRTFLRHGLLDDMEEVASWDFTAMARGELPPFGSASSRPWLFVCTHSGRDACCATHGRALLGRVHAALSPAEREEVWECSHLGGHRFAPTALALPAGSVHGRLDVEAALGARTAHLEPDHLRGRSFFPAPMQTAEIRVRQEARIHERDALDVLWRRDGRSVPVDPGVTLDALTAVVADVRHRDGRSWLVSLQREPLHRPRRESCGKEQVPGSWWRVVALDAAPPWTT